MPRWMDGRRHQDAVVIGCGQVTHALLRTTDNVRLRLGELSFGCVRLANADGLHTDPFLQQLVQVLLGQLQRDLFPLAPPLLRVFLCRSKQQQRCSLAR